MKLTLRKFLKNLAVIVHPLTDTISVGRSRAGVVDPRERV